MLNNPEGRRMRHVGLGLVMAAGVLSVNGSEHDPTVKVITQPSEMPVAGPVLGPYVTDRMPMRKQRATRNRARPAMKSLGEFESTCYNLTGTTASGLRAGPGRVAVDPDVIPLGTRLYVEGYGKAVAADTGGVIDGRIVDIWKPTRSQCLKWGRRMVEVSLLP